MSSRKEKIENGIKMITFLGGLLFLMYILQNVMVYKFKYPLDTEDHLGRFTEFNQLDESTLDVIVVGTSHAMNSINPSELYKNEGISAYNLASSGQTIDLTYEILKQAFKSQQPQVVLLDASNLFADGFDNARWRRVLDSIPIKDKYQIAKAYIDDYTIDNEMASSDGWQDIQYKLKVALACIVPLYYYHGRWSELNEEDFSLASDFYYAKGHNLISLVMASMTVDTMNDIADAIQSTTTVTTREILNGEEITSSQNEVIYNPTIPENNVEYLKKIKLLCESNNAKMVLFKVPSVADPRLYSAAWTKKIGIGHCHDTE